MKELEAELGWRRGDQGGGGGEGHEAGEGGGAEHQHCHKSEV